MYAYAHDRDADGVWGPQAEGEDCDDADAQVFPGAVELCNGVDDDCDGEVDEAGSADAAPWYVDADDGGWGDRGDWQMACRRPEGHSFYGGDCDDGDAEVNPDAEEICDNGVDDDCDGGPGACRLEGEADVEDVAAAVFLGESVNRTPGATALPGDLNGDGWPDLLIGTGSFGRYDEGALYGVYGPFEGELSLSNADIRIVGSQYELFARDIAPLGDLDRDGELDVAVLSYSSNDYTSRRWGGAYIFRGPLDRVDSTDDAYAYVFSSLPGPWKQLEVVGDQTDDARPDLVIAVPDYDGLAPSGGLVAVVSSTLRGEMDISDGAALIMGDVDGLGWGERIATPGDVDGDGAEDLLVGSESYAERGDPLGRVGLYMGAVGGILRPDDADVTWIGGQAYDLIGAGLGALGDIDHDGYADLAIAGIGVVRYEYGGVVYLMRGADVSGGEPEQDAYCTLLGSTYDLTYATVAAGDINADGTPDVAVGGQNAIGGGGFAGVVSVVEASCAGGGTHELRDIAAGRWEGGSPTGIWEQTLPWGT